MKNLLVFFLFNLLCLSVQGASLEFAFQLGEKQQPRLDELRPDVARQMAFSKHSTKLIAKGMGGCCRSVGYPEPTETRDRQHPCEALVFLCHRHESTISPKSG